MKFLHYPNCSTCRKAAKWLNENGVEVEARHIVEQNPSEEELLGWVECSGLPVNKFFNTSGVRYRELGVKEIVKTATKEELIKLLASDGKLIKRPLLIGATKVLVGFKEAEWALIL